MFPELTARKVVSRPQMPSPKLFTKVWKLLKQNSRAYTLQPLHNLAYILRRTIGDEHMDMVTPYFSSDYVQFVFQCNLAKNITSPYGNFARQYPFSVLRYPD